MFFKIAAGVVAAVILFAIVYVLYVVLQYRRIEDEKTLEIKNPEAEKVRTKESYVVGTYNIGFGAYDKDFSFFMNKGRMLDGDRLIRGKYGKAASREAVVRNTEGAFSAARALKPDFMLFQEVDEKSHRARGVNQLEAAREAFRDYSSVYAENFHTAYLLYPLNDPHGKRRDSKGNTHTEVKVRYFNVSGTRRNYFDDVTVNGGAFVSDKNLSKLQPFPQNRYVVYSSEFLAGFFANNYTVDPYTAFKTAEDRMRETIRRQIIASYNADVVDYLNMSMNHVGKSFKYMLMPVYITATKYRDKLYNQYVNGCTGKITGSAPVSPLKVSVVSLLGAAVIAGVVLLLKFFGAF